MMDEGGRISRRIDHITDKTLESTRRTKALAIDANNKGVETVIELNKQGEKLVNIELRAEEIRVELRDTERQVSRLEGFRLSLCCCFKSRYSSKKIKKTRKRNDHLNNEPLLPTTKNFSNGDFINRLLDSDPREDEIESNLK